MIATVGGLCGTIALEPLPPRPRNHFTLSRQPCRPTLSARRSPRRLYLRLDESRLARASPGSCHDPPLEPCSPSNVPATVRRAAACRTPKLQVQHYASPGTSARARGASSASPEHPPAVSFPGSCTPARAAHRLKEALTPDGHSRRPRRRLHLPQPVEHSLRPHGGLYLRPPGWLFCRSASVLAAPVCESAAPPHCYVRGFSFLAGRAHSSRVLPRRHFLFICKARSHNDARGAG